MAFIRHAIAEFTGHAPVRVEPRAKKAPHLTACVSTAVVFDLEFTAWEGSARTRWMRPGEFREIVQIGAVTVDTSTLGVLDTFDALVQPRINRRLSPYIEELTGITNDAVREHGRDFATAFHDFLAFAGGAICASFGNDDSVLDENLRLYGISRPQRSPEYRNALPWFQANGLETAGISSCEVGARLGVPLKGCSHNALFDCLSVAAGMRVLMERGAPSPFA